MVGKATHPSYDDLAALVAALREQVRALKADNAQLRAELAHRRVERPAAGEGRPEPAADPAAAAAPRKAPPRWAKANVVRVAVRRPRRPRAPVPGRRREVPTVRHLHAPSHCPQCAAELRRGRVVGRRQVLDVVPATVEVIEHVVLERRCRRCGTASRGTMPDLRALVGEHRRVSWRAIAWVAALRTTLRLPLRQLQWLLATGWGLRLSTGELCALLDEAARAGEPAYDALLAEARASPVVHLDETGWREDGRNGYVWTLTTPTVRLFRHAHSRAGAIARQLLGEAAEGVVVSDFYAAYDQLDARHQRCWAHFLRDVHELQEQHPTDTGLRAWAKAVRRLYARAVAWAATAEACPPAARERGRLRFERALLAVCRGQPAAAPHAALCARVERYHPEFFVFVADPAVPPTNNAAERALRPLVIARKISGGTRSGRGSKTRMRLQSLVATWELRGADPVAELLALLRAPRTTGPETAPL